MQSNLGSYLANTTPRQLLTYQQQHTQNTSLESSYTFTKDFSLCQACCNTCCCQSCQPCPSPCCGTRTYSFNIYDIRRSQDSPQRLGSDDLNLDVPYCCWCTAPWCCQTDYFTINMQSGHFARMDLPCCPKICCADYKISNRNGQIGRIRQNYCCNTLQLYEGQQHIYTINRKCCQIPCCDILYNVNQQQSGNIWEIILRCAKCIGLCSWRKSIDLPLPIKSTESQRLILMSAARFLK